MMTRSTENRNYRDIIGLFRLKSSTKIRKSEKARIARLIVNCGFDHKFIHKELWSMVKGQPYEHYENEVWRRWLKQGKTADKVADVDIGKLISAIAEKKGVK